jgi:hypothetical protein
LRRINTYADLWKKLEPLAKYGVNPSFSKGDANELAKSLRAWYFEQGGLFLSSAAREAYFDLQGVLTRLIGGMGWGNPEQAELTSEAREYLRTYGSRLRTSLSRDVGTRTRPKIKGDVEPVDRRLGGMYQRVDDNKILKLEFGPRILRGTRRLSIREINADPPTERPIEVRKWMPERMTILVVLNDPDGKPRERVLLLEGGQLVEGSPPNEPAPTEPALWRPVGQQAVIDKLTNPGTIAYP